MLYEVKDEYLGRVYKDKFEAMSEPDAIKQFKECHRHAHYTEIVAYPVNREIKKNYFVLAYKGFEIDAKYETLEDAKEGRLKAQNREKEQGYTPYPYNIYKVLFYRAFTGDLLTSEVIMKTLTGE